MSDKFSIDELMIRVLPGGFLLTFIFFTLENQLQIKLDANLDFLYTFLFFCASFIIGELLQTLAHELEWMIDIFFKFRRPSKVFLYKNNPVLKNEHKRNELFEHLMLAKEKYDIFQKNYSDIPIFLGRKKFDDDLSQSIFWKLYSEVSDTSEIKMCNRNYLFTRVMSITFFIVTIILLTTNEIQFSYISTLLFLLFLWRARGVARGLVFKTILLNLKR